MAIVLLPNGKFYQTTSRGGNPAIRQLNKNGATYRWLSLQNPKAIEVMKVLGVKPAFT